MKTLKEILPSIPQDQEAQEPLCNILTNDEIDKAIEWAIQGEMKSYALRMADKGLNINTIKQKVAERDWSKSINKEQVIASANQRKHWAEQDAKDREDRKQKQINDMKALLDRCNANYFYSMIKQYFHRNFGDFIYNETNEKYIKTICFFISGDIRFETELGYSFKKGLLIVGDAGLGKTKTIEAIKDNEIRPISIFSMIDIAERVREHGNVDLNTNKIILLDDVGSEQETINHYGTKINWFKDFVETYYLHNQFFNRLLITTNCGGDELEKKYGYRVRSRLREMFNTIELKGNDLRK